MQQRHKRRVGGPWTSVYFLGLWYCLQAWPAQAQSCPTRIWADDFNGNSLDLGRWSYQLGDGCEVGVCGWGNNEEQFYRSQNVSVGNGMLSIVARREKHRGSRYTSGRIRTLNKGDFRYGRVEARIKLTRGQGIWPAFWMMPTDSVYGGWPQSGELDIMENVGHQPGRVHGTLHYGPPPPDNQWTGASYDKPTGPFSDGFHLFAVEREPGVVRWLVDGVLYSTKTPLDVAPYLWPFDERFHLILNVAVGGNWPGSPDATTSFPQTLQVDYVHVYDGVRPYAQGPRQVDYQARGVVYSVGNVPSGGLVTWAVPSGAVITSGQGTPSISVDFGTTGGTVTAEVTSVCGTSQLAVPVRMAPQYLLSQVLENFDAEPAAPLLYATGTLVEVANLERQGVNPSALSGHYTRNALLSYDTVAYNASSLAEVSRYRGGERRLYVDVYTGAPVGTELLVALESSATATSTNYPTGRHSRYRAVTTAQSAWQRLHLAYLDSPDTSVPHEQVDRLMLLFAPNTLSGDVFLFDNLDGYASGTSASHADDGYDKTRLRPEALPPPQQP